MKPGDDVRGGLRKGGGTEARAYTAVGACARAYIPVRAHNCAPARLTLDTAGGAHSPTSDATSA
ncbi:hypothetical protein EON67_07805 [archaeon]|nr:MAG: hypothetical protein EON67_07805 [archaeon]